MGDDKRICVVEAELVSAFKVASRHGNTLSPVIRAAWDTGTLSTLTRNNPLTATDAHISIIGHITREELLRHLDSTEAANGYANRFLWIAVRRSKTLPEGGYVATGALAALQDRLRASLSFGRTVGLLERDSEARVLWYSAYPQLSEGEPGLVGSLLARAEAQVLRLSMLYALIDKSATIREPHLQAALALWDFAARSTRFLFGTRTGSPDADAISDAIRDRGALTRTQVSELFGRHRTSAQIERAIAELVEKNLVIVEKTRTPGRPVERLSSPNSLVSRSQQWPAPPAEAAYHGLLGDIIHTLEPHTEADPAAILLQIIVAYGNAVGRAPHVTVEADKHHCNLFGVIVGDTSKARKGTSWGYARRLLVEADPDWETQIRSGLSSGEGLIAQVADSETSEESE